MTGRTLVDMLRARAEQKGAATAFTFLLDGEGLERSSSYAELDQRARAIGVQLSAVCAPGDRVLLLYPPGLEFIEGFFGCLYAGVVAVPAYPPDPSRLERTLPRLQAIAADAGAKVVATTAPLLAIAEMLFAQAPALGALRWVATDTAPGDGSDWRAPGISGETVAFLQYTSGSTGTPKGVVLTHANLMHNEATIQRAFEMDERSIVVGWLPQYHDMGLIGNVIQPLYVGGRCVLMSPMDFLQRPMRWLRAISKHRATTGGGPNFAFDLCVRKSTPEERAAVDLSTWKLAFTGAEPVRAETMQRFVDAFGPRGFAMESFYPCYGLAEASLIVSGGAVQERPILASIATDALSRDEVVERSGPGAQSFVSSGRALSDGAIEIVDVERRTRCAPGRIGEIWAASPSVARGYWAQPELSAEMFGARLASGEGPYLRTGDLGYLRDGELFITGRLKDLIILRGRNLYPQDIEATVERSHPALRPGCTAAFSVDEAGEERLVIVQEVDRKADDAALDDAIDRIRAAVVAAHEAQAYAVVLIDTGSISKTTSGKIQRHASKRQYLAGELKIRRRSERGDERALADAPARVPPAAGLEQRLAELLAARLEVPASTIDAAKSLGAYGLDSLGTVELRSAIEDELGKLVPLEALLRGPSLRELAEVVQRADAKPSATSAPPSGALTAGEQALWLLQEIEPESTAYHLAAALRVVGELDAAALERALALVIARNPSLRTTIEVVDGAPRKRVHEQPLPRWWARVEVGALDEAALAARAAAEARSRFDLRNESPLRFTLYTAGGKPVSLVAVLHHLASDLWSIALLTKQLGEAYAAVVRGSAPSWTPAQRIDLAADEAAVLRSDGGLRQLAYWHERLAGELPILALPTDRARRKNRQGPAAFVRFDVDAKRTAAARAFGEQQGATLFAVLLSAYAALLHRYSQQRDLLIGFPLNGRTTSARADHMGYAVNTMPLRVDVASERAFSSLLAQVRGRVLEALANQDAPFSRVVEALRADGEHGGAPLFRTIFALQKLPPAARATALTGLVVGEVGARLELGGMVLESTAAIERDAQFDLVLQLAERGDQLVGFFEYDTTLFDRGIIEALAANFSVLLQGLLGAPDEPLSGLPLLGEASQASLRAWNDTGSPRQPALLHTRFEAQAAQTPDAAALRFDDQTLTYRQLDERANQLARALQARGVRPGALVGLYLERSLDMVVGMLATLKAGGAYLPLEPSYPAERLARIERDARPTIVLVHRALRDTAPPASSLLILDEEWPAILALERRAPPCAARPQDLAYVLYTSGSTGIPKGVAIPHEAISNHMAWMLREFGFGADDIVLQKTPFAFDASVWEFHAPLWSGGTLVLARPGAHQEPRALLDAIERYGVTTLQGVPALLGALVEQRPGLERCPTLRRVFSGGEALTTELLGRLAAVTRAEVVNLYGPTETTIEATFRRCTAADLGDRPVPIGRPIDNARVYVLDRHKAPAPIGAAGELYIGGLPVGRGYLGQPAWTAERFEPDPFSATPGGRMYRTGDLARRRGDGALEYLGRVDHQVKIRGFRIELGEIESALAQAEGVRASVVVVRDEGENRRLVGYVVGDVELAALKAQLAETLPDYMVPAAFVKLAALPLTPNGKVDRNALPAPERAASSESEAPLTATEAVIAHIWTEVLGVERVGARDDFFELGGHSLMATRVVAWVCEQLDVELAVSDLFDAPTLSEFARRAASARGSQGPVLEPTPRGDSAPLSFAQERLWFLDRLEPGSVTYHMSAAVRLAGALDTSALQRALEEVVRRHETLRTTFADAQGRPFARVHASARFELPIDELPAGDDPLRHARKEWDRPFDLSTGPLLRIRLLRRSPAEHILLVTMHHIVSDGWSIGILVDEIGALYEAFQQGKAPALPPLPIQYADYAAWQRQSLKGDALERELSYWKGQLAGAPVLLELPTDRPRPAVQSFAGRRLAVALDAELTRGIAELARAEGTTLFMALLAAWQVLLSRYSGQTDVLVGSPIANRTRKEVEGLIGFFVNTLVLRTDLGGRPSFRQVLARVKRTTVEAYAHQELPFERVVEALNPERSLSHAPLFQVTFGLQNGPVGELALSGLTIERLESETLTAKFDLVLNLFERDGALTGALEYATDLFDEATALRMMDGLRLLVKSAVDAPDAPVAELGLLPAAERRQLEAWSTGPAAPPALSVVEAVQAIGRERADAPAVAAAGKALSFGALTARAAGVASALAELGVGAESRVALFLDRRVEMPVAMLGAWYAGAAYVPFEPTAPVARVRAICERAGVACVLTTRALAPRLEGIGVRTLFVEELAERRGTAPVRLAPDALAYILYTSGSTGEPKGVAVSHGSLGNLVGALHERIYAGLEARLGRPLRVGVNASYSFDSSVKQWVMLARGHAVSVVPEEARYDERALLRFVAAERIDALDGTPAQLRPALDVPGGKLPAALLVGGEAIDAALWSRLAALRGTEVFDVYGPTECTVDSTIARVAGASPTIGTAVAGAACYVLDVEGARVPVGVIGELCVGGHGVARGYFGRPDLTAERFVPDPFSATSGARMYRTGDLARYRPDGNLDFVGRVDHQVKVRGFRIELGEIESALGRVAGVREAAVVARQDGEGKRLVAYVAGDVDAAALKGKLEETLPEYMVPAVFVRLDALPRTPNGKVDRKALPEPSQNPAEQGYVAPRNPAEALIAAAWAEVLGVDRVGVHDDFFELGGHSLLATQVISRVQAGLDVEIPVSSLFETPTVAGLAERVASAKRSMVPTLEPMDRGERPPLSFAQERLWFLEQLEPGSTAYHVPAIVRLVGPLDVEALRRTLEEVVRRHESLRTTFDAFEGQPYQRVHECARFELPIEALAGREVMEVARRAWAEPFDLKTSPQVSAKLLRIAAEEHVLVVTMHHIVSDGWSTGVLLREVAPLYQAFRDGKTSPLPPLPLQYVDYATWQRKWLHGEVLEAELSYWKLKLAGAPPVLELPLDRPRPAVQDTAARRVAFALSVEQTRGINMLAREQGATLYMTLLAAWQLLLSRYGGQLDVVVGSPIANRTRQEVEGLIGFFANTLVLRTQLDGRPSFRALLDRVKRTTLEAYEHQEVPFERVVEATNPPRSLSHTPLFQVLFVLQNAPMEEMHLPGLQLTHVDPERDSGKFDLTLNVIEREGELTGTLEYATALFDEASVLRLVESFRALLAGAVRAPEVPADELPLTADLERALGTMGSAHEAPIRRTLAHHYFEAQASATPDALAVIDAKRRWTYRELDERASRIAAYLQSVGVAAEDRVCLALERGVDAAAATLGVLKAGAVCVPLEPANPAARIAFMVKEAGARIVLAHATLRHLLDGSEARIVELDRAWNEIAKVGRAYVPRGHADNLIYVIYTSGSTGKPKGVALPHRALCNIMDVQLATLPPRQRTLQFASLGFDVSYQELLGALADGGSLHYLEDEVRLDVERLGAFISEHRIERMHLPVVMMQQLAERFAAEPGALSELRDVVTAGEALVVSEAIVRLFERLPQARLHNHYGPSETHVITAHTLLGPPAGWPRRAPIGARLPNCVARVLDPQLGVQPRGALGELYLGGAHLARGYLGRPELTAERFLPDPYSSEPGARMYRTGDLVRVRNDGDHEYLGRTDQQVKIRGFRIELGEVESALCRVEGVHEAVAVARDEHEQKRLVAYYVGSADTAALRSALKHTLPEFMVPTVFMKLDALPLNPNGKVDRKLLPAPEIVAARVVPPENDVQRALCEIWQEILHLDKVGIDDNYFDLGGDSIRSVQVATKARARGLALTVRDLFSSQTIRELSVVVRELEPAAQPAGGDASGLSKAQVDALQARLRDRARSRTKGSPRDR